MSFNLWTLGLQAINVAILLWLLGRFFWRPVAKMIDDRRLAVESVLAEAEGKRQAADAALAEIANTRAGFAAERDAVLARAQADGEAARRALLDRARAESAALLAAAREAIDAQREKAEAEWRAAAADLGVDIAGRLLAPLATADIQQAFAARLVETVATLPESQKRSLLTSPGRLELVMASPTPEPQSRALQHRLAEALDADLDFDVKLDPHLIAGIDLVAPHFILHNSWRADLDQLRQGLDHAGR